MKYQVRAELAPNGFTVFLNKSKHSVAYPAHVWQAFPKQIHQSFAEFIAFVSTVSYAFGKNYIEYQFPSPVAESFFYFGLLMSMPENWTDTENKKLKSSQYLKIAYNSYFNTHFTGHTHAVEIPLYASRPKTVLIPFSFGKDSLLTYALSNELGLTSVPIFMIEPKNRYENKHKQILRQQFTKEFNQTIEMMKVPLTSLKRDGTFSWGWDLLLTQYTLFLIPFMHFYKAEYFFWSDEYSCSQTVTDAEGFTVSTTFDQNSRWLQTLNEVLRMFGVPAKLGSIIEPLSEIADFYILHKRYPEIAKYHLTCQGEHPTKRWCGKCYDCAKFYVYMSAFGFDPSAIGLVDNMLSLAKMRKLRFLTDPQQQTDFWRDTFPFYRDEKLLALWLTQTRVRPNAAIKLFISQCGSEAQKRTKELYRRYLRVHKPAVRTNPFEKFTDALYEEELAALRKTLP